MSTVSKWVSWKDRHPDTCGEAHAAFVGALLRNPPHPIPVDARAIDCVDRADHLTEVLNAVSLYVAAILDDTAQNVPGGLDRRPIVSLLADLVSEVTGTLRQGAAAFPGEMA